MAIKGLFIFSYLFAIEVIYSELHFRVLALTLENSLERRRRAGKPVKTLFP